MDYNNWTYKVVFHILNVLISEKYLENVVGRTK